MYNLLVTNQLPDLREDDPVAIDRPRFLEYTSKSIVVQLETLSVEATAAIKSWPSLVMAEGRGAERAYLARITHLTSDRSAVTATLQRLPTSQPVLNDDLWKARGSLSIEQFEFTRHHWAVKDCDLLVALSNNGIATTAHEPGFDQHPLPAPPRAALFEARTVVGNWGHTEIDDLLLEAGVEGLQAGREFGSRRDRANAIVRFILDNPGATTADEHLLSSFFVRATGVLSGNVPQQSGEQVLPVPDRAAPEVAEAPTPPNRVFVVHGRDEAARGQVVEFLRHLGLEAIVLHEQPNMGRHLLTKFIDEAELVAFAVVLMTADDVGGTSGDSVRPRARQNVILELGYFLSHLGQARVCALISPGLETPSDFDGVVYIEMSENDRWKDELRPELIAGRIPVE
jgi:predicted nucleotide-binding protein